MSSSRTIDVAFAPDAIRPAGVAVVFDVLRASSTIVAALEAGYRRVLCASSLITARRLRDPERVLAGERRCVPPLDFDLGNSPQAMEPAWGEELVLSTTNGAPAIATAARHARRVVVGALANLAAAAAAVRDDDVLLVCAGNDGRPALEDVYAAGLMSARLDGTRTDAAIAAERVAVGFGDPVTALSAGSNAATLRGLGLDADIGWCARVSVSEVVPVVTAVVDGVPVIERSLSVGADIAMDLDETPAVGSRA